MLNDVSCFHIPNDVMLSYTTIHYACTCTIVHTHTHTHMHTHIYTLTHTHTNTHNTHTHAHTYHSCCSYTGPRDYCMCRHFHECLDQHWCCRSECNSHWDSGRSSVPVHLLEPPPTKRAGEEGIMNSFHTWVTLLDVNDSLSHMRVM